MDDLSISDERLEQALRDLRRVNRLLGAYRASNSVLDPLLDRRDELHVVELACGGADYLPHLVRRGRRRGCTVRALGIDVNPVTVGHARAYMDARLPPPLRSRVRIDTGDALDSGYPPNAFDVAHAALFLHHLHGPEATALLREMNRLSDTGIVVNDLHRHPLAYAGIWTLSRLLCMGAMVRHDGPLSVRRGFVRSELRALARRVHLPDAVIEWHWAFRWILSTCPRFES